MIGAENFQLYIHKTARLTFFEINGKTVTDKSFYTAPFNDYYIMDYFGWQKSGVDFSLECNVDLPIELLVFEKKLGLPAELDFMPMPVSVIPQTGYESYLSLVKSKFVF
jgi:hypothetical protein